MRCWRPRLIAKPQGMTLVELMVALSISAVLITAVSGMLLSINSMWERSSSGNSAQLTLSEGVTRITTDMKNAVSCQILTRFSTNDAVIITLPAGGSVGQYAPQMAANKIQYVAGTMRAYYLSNETGSWRISGNILWAGTVTSLSPVMVTPDISASLWPSTTIGQVQPLSALRIDAPTVSDPQWLYTIKLTAPVRIAGKSSTIEVVRRVLTRNHQ